MTAEEIVNHESEANLARIFKEYGEERRARSIARKIAHCAEKRSDPFEPPVGPHRDRGIAR